MAEVSGSKQYRSMVVQHRPGRRPALVASLLLLLIASSGLCYWLGGLSNSTEYQDLVSENAELSEQLQLSQASLAETAQQLANISTGADIDRQAVNEVRTVISEHKQTINELNEEINFYKGLMSPTEKERGLGIRSWELYPGSTPRRFQFKLVMQQLALKHSMLKGEVRVDIVGRRAGMAETLSLDILSEEIKSAAIKLRFKYFQYVDGELQLPVDFKPERIDIIATASSPNKVKVEKHFGWLVQ